MAFLIKEAIIMKKSASVLIFLIFNLQVIATNCEGYYELLANNIYQSVDLDEGSSGPKSNILIQQKEVPYADRVLVFHNMKDQWKPNQKLNLKRDINYSITYTLTDLENEECDFFDRDQARTLYTSDEMIIVDDNNITNFVLYEINGAERVHGRQELHFEIYK